MIGFASLGIHETCIKSVKKCSEDIQSSLFGSIILSGGSSLFPGLAERLQSEITDLAPPNIKAKVIDPSSRKYSVWLGASIVASLSTFHQMYIGKWEYDEYGPSIIHCIRV
ncbi:actin, cytoskeletal 3-like [Dysidea avara]|uniref:actin, cytoskeletal 3-like n=1 Tax=Dysidea avara TaxID=196820 RepID=UPI00331C8C7B